jgi:hypothetical protein
MSPTAPAWKPQINRSRPHEGPFSQRPAVKGALRALNLIGGFAVALVAFFVVGAWAALLGCVGEETRGLCVDNAWLVPVLEWPIFVIAVVAPLAGAVASFVKREPTWLFIGTLAAVLMGGAIAAVSTGQTGLMG